VRHVLEINLDPSVQDDLESIGYVIMFFLAGGKNGLPWGQLRSHAEIAAAKSDVSIGAFCQNLHGTEYEPISHALQNYLYLVRDKSRPFSWDAFRVLYQEFEMVLYNCGWKNDHCYDWVEEKQQINSSSCTTLFNPELNRIVQSK
jgi:hypothetical protein